MGTYTPNYNLYMPSIGEQGWGELVSNNFEILDTNLNDLQNQITTNLNNLQDQINVIDTNIGNGTRILSISSPTITSSNFGSYTSYDVNNVYFAQFGGENVTFESISVPEHSCRLMIISVSGNLTINGNIDTYPTSLQSELPPDSETTNTYVKNILLSNFSTCTLTYTANANNSQITMDYNDYLNFVGKEYTLSIPHAIAAGGNGSNGTSGTETNTCNGGGGSGYNANQGGYYTGGTGCIFGQYAGGSGNGYGYGSGATNKYRCGLVIIVNGNLTINESGTITQAGGKYGTSGAGSYGGGYGGGARYSGGGGAPVFIYYTGSYVNNGTINTAGGSSSSSGHDGGAGGIKVTQISLQ